MAAESRKPNARFFMGLPSLVVGNAATPGKVIVTPCGPERKSGPAMRHIPGTSEAPPGLRTFVGRSHDPMPVDPTQLERSPVRDDWRAAYRLCARCASALHP